MKGSVIKIRQAKDAGFAYIFERARDDVDHNITMSLVHAFFPENVDNDLRTVVESDT